MIYDLLSLPTALASLSVGVYAILLALSPFSPRLQLPTKYVITLDEETKPGHGPVRRVGTPPKPHATSMLESLQRTVTTKGNNNFLGHRLFDANGTAQAYVWQTYAQVYKRIQNFAAGLAHEKMMEKTADGDRPLCLYMKNRPEWVIGHYASMYLGGFPVALYDTLGLASAQFILNQTLALTVVCTSAEFPAVITAKKDVPTLKFVVLVDAHILSDASVAVAEAVGLKLTTMAQIEALGAQHPLSPVMPKSSDTYCLVYTSGTTGTPKGALMTHMNVLMGIEGDLERLDKGKHGRTFTDQGVHLSQPATEDLAELRPTIFVSVPRLLNKIYDKVITAGRSAGGIKSWLFDLAMSTKLANLKQGYTKHALFDKLIFSKVQKKLGLDRCCMLVSGAAPLAEDVMDFYRILFDFPIVEGYGQSETVAAATIMHLDDTHAGTVGYPVSSIDIKLKSVPEMGYNVTDTVHGDDESTCIPVLGRGEICFRGPVVFPGYYKEPTKTAEVFDDDGWLLSGNIGVWTLDGRLKIVDRKKNIFKLSQGEYIAPEKIENVWVTSPYVAQPFVYGDSLHAVLVAIIVPEEEHLMNLAKKLNVSGTFEDACRDTRVVDAVLKDLVAISKKNNLFGYETVKAIKLHPMPFTIESNLMTPTFKLKRQDAKAVFRHDITALYEKCGDLVAGSNVQQG
ncbi:unnamed protein product [Aphanomyces euteiches]